MEMMNRNANELDLFSALDLINELTRRGYDLRGAYEKSEMNSKMKNAFHSINWENWVEDDGQSFKLGEVYWSRLEWAKGEQENDEIVDLMQDIQDTICPILNLLDNQ